MATILRSSNYVRCLNTLARRIITGKESHALVKIRPEHLAHRVNSYLTKSYATVAAVSTKNDRQSHEKAFERLENSVQRTGRVFFHEVEEILTKVQQKGHLSSLEAVLLIRCCGNLLVDSSPQKRIQFVNKIWETINTIKTSVDVTHFNALLRVYLENNYRFEPTDFLTTMRDKNVEPNRITYQRMIMYYCKTGDIAGATKILQFMRERQIPLNEAVFSALIIGHSEAGDMKSAENILNVMKEANIDPSSNTYTALMTAYAKRGDMASIKKILDDIGNKNVFLYNQHYFEVIQSLAANDHTDKIDSILSLMSHGLSYNLDAIHAILKILDVGNVEAALKIFNTMQKSKRADDFTTVSKSGEFLLRKMVRSKFPVEQIIDICTTFVKTGENPDAFSVVVRQSLMNGDTNQAIALMEAWRTNGGELREHYFWPLLVAEGRASNYQGVLVVVQTMVKLGISISIETMSNYILPFTPGKWDRVSVTLRGLNVPHNVIIEGIARRMLSDNRINKTSLFMMDYPIKYHPEYLYEPLVNAYRTTGDVESYASILRLLADPLTADETTPELTSRGVVDSAMRHLLSHTRESNLCNINQLLEKMVDFGLSMSPEIGENVRKFVRNNITPKTEENIEKLTSGTLTLSPLGERKMESKELASDEMEENKEVSMEQRQLLFRLRNAIQGVKMSKQSDEVEKIIQELENKNYNLSSALISHLVEMYCNLGNIEKTQKWMKAIVEKGDQINFYKSIRYATLLIDNGQFDDAIQYIRETPKAVIDDRESLKWLVKGLLQATVRTGNVQKTNELFEALKTANYLSPDTKMLTYLIKVHFRNEDLAGALAAFESACTTYQCTPMKNVLFKKLIDAEDANSLQKVTDLCTTIHGEDNTLNDLALAFVECGRLRQARKILETSVRKITGKRLEAVVRRYFTPEARNHLDDFLQVSRGLSIINPREFCNVFIDQCVAADEYQLGLDMWTNLQDDDIVPTNYFLKNLANLLRKHNQSVPFTVENISSNPVSKYNTQSSTDTAEFYSLLEENKLEKAEDTLRKMSSNHKEIPTLAAALIKAYIGNEDVDNAAKVAEHFIAERGILPRMHSLKTLWDTFIKTKQFKRLRKHSLILNQRLKKNYRFSKFLGRAHIKEHGLDHFLDDLTLKLDDPRPQAIRDVKISLHFNTIIQELQNQPEALPKFEQITEKAYARGLTSPAIILWSVYLMTGKPEAEDVWNKYIVKTDSTVFRHILDESQRNNDVDLAKRVHDKISGHPTFPEVVKLFVRANLVDLYVYNGRLDEAIELVEGIDRSFIDTWKENHAVVHTKFLTALKSNNKQIPSSLSKSQDQI